MALYDPNEFPSEVRTDFSLADVLAWARTMRSDQEYDYLDGNSCAVAQFLIDTGRSSRPMVGGNPGVSDWVDDHGNHHPYPDSVAHASIGKPRNFGAFADRLEKAIALEMGK